MKIAMLSPIAWRTPPRHYGPWENVVSLLTEGLVKRGIEVTLFATKESSTKGRLHAIVERGYEEDKSIYPKVWECLHISEVMEKAEEFDLIHNHFDFLPLSYSQLIDTPMLTTIHGFSSFKILPVYKKYNNKVFYVAISNADRSPELNYLATIYHGIDLNLFTFREKKEDYLLFFGRIHHDKGAKEAIEIAKRSRKRLLIAGVIQDEEYFKKEVKPNLDGENIVYVGSADPKYRDDLLGKAKVLIHPINFEEPFGLSIIESFACGTPVIAFNKGSMPELIKQGKNGYLVDNIEEAVEAIEEVDKIDKSFCRKFVEENFSAEMMVEKYIEVYKEILDKTKREDHRPWGYYKVLSDLPDHKVKRILVYPHKRLSLQRHKYRREHWHLVSGKALVTLDKERIYLKEGESIDIPEKAAHRIENIGDSDLVFIEVQRGSYFGEDDIERLEDDYGRI